MRKLIEDISKILDVKIRDCYNSYVAIKKRKDSGRTYFLDKLSKILNRKMNLEDGCVPEVSLKCA